MKIAFIFPGQGAQKIGMMEGFINSPIVKEVFDEAGSVLGQDLWEMTRTGPVEDLNLTVNTQPLMLTVGYAVFRLWQRESKIQPVVMAGHSLGEYSALVAAGSLSFADAVSLVRFRATVMQEAVPPGVGAMAAVLGVGGDVVREACRTAQATFPADAPRVVEAVNFNEHTQTVIAGHKEAVDLACQQVKELGAKRTIFLPVSAPFHSSLLKGAADRLRGRLQEVEIKAPQIPVLHNVDVMTHAEPEEIRRVLALQSASPVRWVDTIEAMVKEGVSHIVEMGPGKILQGMVKRIAPGVEVLSIGSDDNLKSALAQLGATR